MCYDCYQLVESICICNVFVHQSEAQILICHLEEDVVWPQQFISKGSNPQALKIEYLCNLIVQNIIATLIHLN